MCLQLFCKKIYRNNFVKSWLLMLPIFMSIVMSYLNQVIERVAAKLQSTSLTEIVSNLFSLKDIQLLSYVGNNWLKMIFIRYGISNKKKTEINFTWKARINIQISFGNLGFR